MEGNVALTIVKLEQLQTIKTAAASRYQAVIKLLEMNKRIASPQTLGPLARSQKKNLPKLISSRASRAQAAVSLGCLALSVARQKCAISKWPFASRAASRVLLVIHCERACAKAAR